MSKVPAAGSVTLKWRSELHTHTHTHRPSAPGSAVVVALFSGDASQQQVLEGLLRYNRINQKLKAFYSHGIKKHSKVAALLQ